MQPNYGLDELFGAKESYVEFTPDILDDLTLEVRGSQNQRALFPAGIFFTSAERPRGRMPTAGSPPWSIRSAKGKALLIGTFPGGGYYLHHTPAAKAFFAGLLDWAKVSSSCGRTPPARRRGCTPAPAAATFMSSTRIASPAGDAVTLPAKFTPVKTSGASSGYP